MKAFLTFSYCFFAVLFEPAFAFELETPLACIIGKDCWIQQYADHDSGAGAADYQCGSESYDKHDGTDFRVLDTLQQTDVIASAEGTVIGWRDGMDDHLINTPQEVAALGNRECGNGVVLDHGSGWQTQYCHLRRGSVLVKNGQHVKLGEKLGLVGFSGAAAFPHVHLSVRHNGEKIDPFSGAVSMDCRAPPHSLWSTHATAALTYHTGDILAFGLASENTDLGRLVSGIGVPTEFKTDWPAIFAQVWMINLQLGDAIKLDLLGPGGMIASNSAVLDHNKAQYLLLAGKLRGAQAWPQGRYIAHIQVLRAGKMLLEKDADATFK